LHEEKSTNTGVRMRALIPVLVCLFLICGASQAAAGDDPRILGWQDLIPATSHVEDPFAELIPDQLDLLLPLSKVEAYRMRAAADEPLSEKDSKHLADLSSSLAEKGVDVDGLLARRAEFREERRATWGAVETSLDNQYVRIAGFVLPLEFDGTRVTEFLLVPTVGACIHVPPPPANQMVHVSVTEGIESKGLFAPVWVEGTLSIEGGQSELFLSDGTAGVSFGYRMEALRVVDYEE